MSSSSTEAPQTNYYANIIAPVLFHKKLEPGAKLLYAHISSLSNERGYAWASNDYLAEKHDVDTRTIQRWLHTLSQEKFLHIHLKKDKFYTERKLFISKTSFDDFKKSLRNDISAVSATTKMSPSTRHFCHPNTKAVNNKDEKNTKHTPTPKGESAIADGGFSSDIPDAHGEEARPLARKIIDRLQAHNPAYQPVVAAVILPELDKLRVQHSDDTILSVVEWALNHHIWCACLYAKRNIAKYLRSKFAQLYAGMNAPTDPSKRQFARGSDLDRALKCAREMEAKAI